MSKDSDKAEPSMDDILASIRRIIDEDGSKSRKPAAAPAGGKAAADILELTEMVNDDGSVTSLEKPVAAAAAKLIDDDEPPIYADRGDRAPGVAPLETIRPNLAGDPKSQNAPPIVERTVMPQPTPPRPATPPQPAQAAQTQAQPPRIGSTIGLGGGISLTPVSTPPSAPAQQAGQQSGLVSGQTATAATAAFDRLAQAALQQQQPPAPAAAPRAPSPTIGGRALEDMVAEMLRPMLQNWLDTNLPAIVERLVQQEIQKMSKR